MSTPIQDGHGVKLVNLSFCSNHLYFRSSQYFLVMSCIYFCSASVLWTLEHYMRCNTQSSDMGWHPLCHPTLSFLTSETRINITNGHNPHTAHHQEGSCLFVYIYSITGIKEFCQSQVKRESIYLLILLTTFRHQNGPVIATIRTLTQCCSREWTMLYPSNFLFDAPIILAAACWLLLSPEPIVGGGWVILCIPTDIYNYRKQIFTV